MYEDLQNVLEDVLENENEANKFLEMETMDELYEYFKNKIPDLSVEEFDSFIFDLLEEYAKNAQSAQNLDPSTLSKVAGGADAKSRIAAAAMSLLSLFPMAPVGSAHGNAESVTSSSQSIATEGQGKFDKIKDMLLGKFKSAKQTVSNKYKEAKEFVADKYAKSKKWVIENPKLSAGIAFAAVVITAAITYKLRKSPHSGQTTPPRPEQPPRRYLLPDLLQPDPQQPDPQQPDPQQSNSQQSNPQPQPIPDEDWHLDSFFGEQHTNENPEPRQQPPVALVQPVVRIGGHRAAWLPHGQSTAPPHNAVSEQSAGPARPSSFVPNFRFGQTQSPAEPTSNLSRSSMGSPTADSPLLRPADTSPVPSPKTPSVPHSMPTLGDSAREKSSVPQTPVQSAQGQSGSAQPTTPVRSSPARAAYVPQYTAAKNVQPGIASAIMRLEQDRLEREAQHTDQEHSAAPASTVSYTAAAPRADSPAPAPHTDSPTPAPSADSAAPAPAAGRTDSAASPGETRQLIGRLGGTRPKGRLGRRPPTIRHGDEPRTPVVAAAAATVESQSQNAPNHSSLVQGQPIKQSELQPNQQKNPISRKAEEPQVRMSTRGKHEEIPVAESGSPVPERTRIVSNMLDLWKEIERYNGKKKLNREEKKQKADKIATLEQLYKEYQSDISLHTRTGGKSTRTTLNRIGEFISKRTKM